MRLLASGSVADERTLTLASDGAVLVDGIRPLDDPEATLRGACQ